MSGVPALAQGGNDPVPSIDIIIYTPDTKPVAGVPLSGGEVKQFNALKGSDRSAYLAGLVAPHLAKSGKERSEKEWAGMLAAALGDSWCGPCRTANEKLEHEVKLKDGISEFITASF